MTPGAVVSFGFTSDAWRMSWLSYCTYREAHTTDPHGHSPGFILDFLDHVGQLAQEELQVLAEDTALEAVVSIPAGRPHAKSRPVPSSVERPVKRQALDSPSS